MIRGLKVYPSMNRNPHSTALIPQFGLPRRESYIVCLFQPWFSSLAEHKDGVFWVTSPCSHAGAISIMCLDQPQLHVVVKTEVSRKIEFMTQPMPEIGQTINGNHTLDCSLVSLEVSLQLPDGQIKPIQGD